MDKHRPRTLTKLESIKRAALELFAAYGVDRVSMDEIAAKANVSKVTIYKYFESKEQLYTEVINLFVDETLAATEDILNSDMDFLEKLKLPLRIQTNSSQLVSFNHLFQVWEEDSRTTKSIQNKVKVLMYKLYEEGKKKGYIREDLPFEILYQYAEIFRAGFKATAADPGSALVEREALEELYNLYFFGFINRPPADHPL